MKTLIANHAQSTLASSVSGGALSFTVATGEGSLFPEIHSSLEDFYVRLGDEITNEVVRCTARAEDTMTCEALTMGWSSATPVALTVNRETFNDFPRMIQSNQTLTVKSSGGDFTNLASALTALQDVFIVPSATVTIVIDPGKWMASGVDDGYTAMTPIYANQLSADRILIKGVSAIDQQVTSIESVGGSSWNQDITLNLHSSVDMSLYAIDMSVVIKEATGGTDPANLIGCHRITAVDVPNKRITIKSLNKNSPPSGAVTTETMVLLRTRLWATLNVNGCFGWSVSDLAVYMDTSIETVLVEQQGTLKLGPHLAVMGSVVSRDRGYILASAIAVTVGGLLAYRGGYLDADYAILCGCSVSLGAYDSGIVRSSYSIINGCTYGILCKSQGFVLARGINISNTLNDSVNASIFGYVNIYSATTSSTTPSVDTQGNVYGYIDTTYIGYDLY